jgi:hypothetical protein
METLTFTRSEFDYLKELQIKRRWDWPATFSTNCHGEIWLFWSYGYTRSEDREQIRGLSSVIDQVADIYLRIRSEGGRFFVSDEGALYWDEVVGGKRVIAFFQIT